MPGPEQTAEDKLLEIIENPAHQAPSAVPARVRVKDFASLVAFVRTFDARAWLRRPDLGHVNRALAVICVILTVLGVAYVRKTNGDLDRKFAAVTVPASAAEEAVPEKDPRAVNFSQTLTLAKEHNIFSLRSERAPVEGLLVGDGEATANLKLVGILWSDTHPQAMVEDTVEQKTHLLAVGDQVARLTVRSITKDKVILARDDRVWELR